MYLWKQKTILLTGSERFSTLIKKNGIPDYYPTCFMLDFRMKGVSHNTMISYCQALVHLGIFSKSEHIDIHRRMENGEYLTSAEIEMLVEASSVSTQALRQRLSKNVVSRHKPKTFSRDDLVSNGLKSTRLTIAANYMDMIARMSESHLPKRSDELKDRVSARKDMVDEIKFFRPKIRDSRIAGIPHDELARVTQFLLSKTANNIDMDEEALWQNPALIERNWAILRTLLECGIRNSELRQLKVEDVDLNKGVLTVYRRPDDPEDPRLLEPNAKTYDRHIPISDDLCQFIENYMLSYGSEAAEASGSPFLFLSHSNRNFGQPIDSKTVSRVVEVVGDHLGIGGLTPHDLRHTWIQNLADWSIREGIDSAEFVRFANNLGGWSYLSKMATEYRGDQLTEAAFKAGLKIEEQR